MYIFSVPSLYYLAIIAVFLDGGSLLTNCSKVSTWPCCARAARDRARARAQMAAVSGAWSRPERGLVPAVSLILSVRPDIILATMPTPKESVN